ncbi:hypothetical protein NDN08_007438 [Rhodosorus marinus]|uniref:AAA+ ATPase domain-containing protein n=1 Tax=Rhodosorus marinus TaxID=101924 RepID=A0AAV8UXJ5_9RHOD|nr:hypothetical protein NDN08_007438 [Rhodosorus marinus]
MREDAAMTSSDKQGELMYKYEALRLAEGAEDPVRRAWCFHLSGMYNLAADDAIDEWERFALEEEGERFLYESISLGYEHNVFENTRKVLHSLYGIQNAGAAACSSTENEHMISNEDDFKPLQVSEETIFKFPSLVAELVAADIPSEDEDATHIVRNVPVADAILDPPKKFDYTPPANENLPKRTRRSESSSKLINSRAKPSTGSVRPAVHAMKDDDDMSALLKTGKKDSGLPPDSVLVDNQETTGRRHYTDAPPSLPPNDGGFRTASSSLGKSKPEHQRRANQSADSRHRGTNGAGVFRRPRPLGAPAQDGEAEDAKKDLPKIPNVAENLVEMIMNEVMDKNPGVEWEDIAGLHFPKKCVMEAVIWPMVRPDIFTGLRGPPKGLLLFGPPGTGKTMIGKAIASKSGATFFNISASSLTSKWVGEGEKTVRALFAVARMFQPSVIFIDEIDSLLTARTDSDQESTRRIKTEFLVQMDGAATTRDDRVLVVGATNRPQELDEAARRRLVKRLYIPLPDLESRTALIARLLKNQENNLASEGIAEVSRLSEGYSGSDLYSLCAEAALGPVRDLGDALSSISADGVRKIDLEDFRVASRLVRASVGSSELEAYIEWNRTYGSFAIDNEV